MAEKVLKAESRELKGKNNNRRLRVEGKIPAVLYSHGESESLSIVQKDLFNLFKGKISENVIFNLSIVGKEDSDLMAYVKDFQKNGVTGEVKHLDLYKVTKGEKIKTSVPVELVGTPVGIKLGGVLKHGEREIAVACLPKDLPEKFVVDITSLDQGDSFHVSEIEHGDEIEIITNPTSIVAAVSKPRSAEEEVAEVEEVEETEEA